MSYAAVSPHAGPWPARAAAAVRSPPTRDGYTPLHRERQKGTITELEGQVVSKLEELRLLSQENKVLRLKTSVLQRAVDGWNEQVGPVKAPRAQRRWRVWGMAGSACQACCMGPFFLGASAVFEGPLLPPPTEINPCKHLIT
jgi:hypothetical protein